MSFLFTVDELREDALFRAGEPQSSTSSFWDASLRYMNRVQRQLVLGGGVAIGRDLATSAGIYSQLTSIPLTDWWWARKLGKFNTLTGVDTLTATATQGSASVTLSAAPSVNVTGWRIQIDRKATVPKIIHVSGTTATLDDEWPEDDVTAGSSVIFQQEYDLAPDFVRYASPPYAHSNFARTIPVASREAQFENYPWASLVQGRPTRAFQLKDQRVAINAWDDRPYRLEYEYIAMPDDLQAGGTPILPSHHRMILSTGASMLILMDKNDIRAENFASEYRELVLRMLQEHRKGLSAGSPTFGLHRVREGQSAFFRRQRSLQPFGELFLT